VDWRESILVEFYTYENPMPWLVDMDYRAVRTDRYKHIHWVRHPAEPYDLTADPFEMTNLIDRPASGAVAEEMRRELGRLSLEALGLTPAPPAIR
jgi:arylsulfatase A-like enzyme